MSDGFSNNAVIPIQNTQKDFYDWEERHRCKKAQAELNRYELVFIGDSITQMFELPECGGRVWIRYFSKYTALNLGYGWDCTQNVLWRLENGEFENQTPRVVVLNIGTNNLTGNSGGRANSAVEIVEGILSICAFIHKHSVETKIIVMSVFPRGRTTDTIFALAKELRELIKEVPRKDSRLIHLDIGEHFLGSDGEIKIELLDDLVHPTEAGY